MSKTGVSKPTVAPATATQNTKPKFVFEQYQDDVTGADPSRIDEFITEEFSFDEWQPAWIRYDGHEAAVKRYYSRVQRDTHGHLFKDEAFDPIHNIIGKGKERLNPMLGGIPEVALYIRPREAADEEQRQMSAASARRLQDNQKLQEIRDKIGNVVGTDSVFGGVSMGRGWGE